MENRTHRMPSDSAAHNDPPPCHPDEGRNSVSTGATLKSAYTGSPSSSIDAELFPIRTVSSLTGVNAITLRAWERRYGLVRPVRTATGHRLYRRDEIDLIHRVVALLDKGISIGQVQRVLSQSQQTNIPADAKEDTSWARLRRHMLSAIARFDEDALEDIYDEALGIAAIRTVTGELLVPLLEELESHRHVGEAGLAEDRFFRTYLRNRLGARHLHHLRRLNIPRCLGACLPGESDDTGLLLFALTANEMGLRSILLGTDVPLSLAAVATKRGRCDAVVLQGAGETDRGVLTDQLRRLTTDVSAPVFVRGTVSIHRRDQIVAANAIPLGNDLVAGAKRVVETLRIEQR